MTTINALPNFCQNSKLSNFFIFSLSFAIIAQSISLTVV
ncbi:hypothetical protein RV15_GL000050 [Enterococcus silesiacus]|uniref:Uncharacterized protein n=1 Tax=Enterococcus silesiacus TaxID=332949 RepID=A0AA91JQX6_9ENTE|nr:hypothetical protein RV15_GL000050 [Enterococcus silesiacus]